MWQQRNWDEFPALEEEEVIKDMNEVFNKIFKNLDMEEEKKRWELWQRGPRFDVLFWYENQLVASIYLAKHTLYFGDYRPTALIQGKDWEYDFNYKCKHRPMPFHQDQLWMEFETLCILMLQLILQGNGKKM